MFQYINNMLPVILNSSFTLNKDLHKHNTRARDKIFDKIYMFCQLIDRNKYSLYFSLVSGSLVI